jgi:hypothetical protein
MTSDSDRLNSEVSLSVKLESKALSVSTKSRLFSSMDRLLGSVIDIPTSWLEGKSERIRIKNQLEAEKLKASNGSLEAVTLEIIEGVAIEKELKAITNKKAVVEAAIEHLRAEDASLDGEIEEEWLSVFERFSEFATSTRLRDIWGRVLAGQIHDPRQFSLSTLRFIAELDSNIAQLFEKYVQIRSPDGFILAPKQLEGQQFQDLNLLMEVGLLLHVGGFAQSSAEQQSDGCFYFFGGNLALKIKLVDAAQSTISTEIIFITRVGKEICTILPEPNYEEYLRQIEKNFDTVSESSEIVSIVERLPDGRVKMKTQAILKGKPQDTHS